MSIIATAVKHLLAAGVTGDALVQAIADMEANAPATVAVDTGPSKGALRTRAWRERQEASQNVTRDAGDVTVTENVTSPPSLDKETSPRPPKEIKPIPRVTPAGALPRKAGGFSAPDGVPADRWSAFCQQRKKAVTRIAFDRICKTLNEAREAGWPPGEVVERSIESGYETVFVPKEFRNGQRPRNDRSEPQNAMVRAVRNAEAREARDAGTGF